MNVRFHYKTRAGYLLTYLLTYLTYLLTYLTLLTYFLTYSPAASDTTRSYNVPRRCFYQTLFMLLQESQNVPFTLPDTFSAAARATGRSCNAARRCLTTRDLKCIFNVHSVTLLWITLAFHPRAHHSSWALYACCEPIREPLFYPLHRFCLG